MKSLLLLLFVLSAFAEIVQGFATSPSPTKQDAATQSTTTRAPRSRRPSFGGQNPQGLKFADRIMRATKAGNPAVLSGLFDSKFILKDCNKTYNREQIVNFLAHPKTPGDYFLIAVDYYKPIDIKFEVQFRARSNLDADVYNIRATGLSEDQRIIEAQVLNCPDEA